MDQVTARRFLNLPFITLVLSPLRLSRAYCHGPCICLEQIALTTSQLGCTMYIIFRLCRSESVYLLVEDSTHRPHYTTWTPCERALNSTHQPGQPPRCELHKLQCKKKSEHELRIVRVYTERGVHKTPINYAFAALSLAVIYRRQNEHSSAGRQTVPLIIRSNMEETVRHFWHYLTETDAILFQSASTVALSLPDS